MKSIRIVTDSMTDIPPHLIERYKIRVVPLTIFFGDEAFQDGIDLTHEAFYERLEKSDMMPRTAQVAPAAFQQVFEEILSEGSEVLCINASSKASGTHQSAMIARESVQTDRIQVVDTMSLSMGAGLLVIETAQALENGATQSEAIALLQRGAEKMNHLFTVDTVKFLQKGGRINPGKALMANILNIKPILTVRKGLVDPLDKVRGSKKVISKMTELMALSQGDYASHTIAIAHANAPEKAELLRNQIIDIFNPKEIIMSEIGCTIGTHTGPGTLALFYKNV